MNRYNYSDLQTFVATMYRGKPFFMRPFAYPVEFLSLAAAATATQFVTIQANADFVVTEIAAVAFTSDYSGSFSMVGSMLITDTGSNEKWTNDFVPVVAYARNMLLSEPHYLAFPRFVQGNTQLQIEFTNANSTPMNAFLALRGVQSKLYSG